MLKHYLHPKYSWTLIYQVYTCVTACDGGRSHTVTYYSNLVSKSDHPWIQDFSCWKRWPRWGGHQLSMQLHFENMCVKKKERIGTLVGRGVSRMHPVGSTNDPHFIQGSNSGPSVLSEKHEFINYVGSGLWCWIEVNLKSNEIAWGSPFDSRVRIAADQWATVSDQNRMIRDQAGMVHDRLSQLLS